MSNFYKKSISFWFILLVLALVNATLRETTYKPFFTPHIGTWAHQISSVTGILFFYAAIYVFLKKMKDSYTKKDLIKAGLLWIFMTTCFESLMNIFLRGLNLQQTLETYYFWKGETWVFVLLSLLISPLVADRILKKKIIKN